MILYRLENMLQVVDVFEDKVIFRPRLFMRIIPGWHKDEVFLYHEMDKIQFKNNPRPFLHLLSFHLTAGRVVFFRFRSQLVIYDRLALFFNRQVEKYNKDQQGTQKLMDLQRRVDTAAA